MSEYVRDHGQVDLVVDVKDGDQQAAIDLAAHKVGQGASARLAIQVVDL